MAAEASRWTRSRENRRPAGGGDDALDAARRGGESGGRLAQLIVWLSSAFDGGPPDAVLLATALQAGLARKIRAALDVPVIGFLQGEDTFLDGLGKRAPEVW